MIYVNITKLILDKKITILNVQKYIFQSLLIDLLFREKNLYFYVL